MQLQTVLILFSINVCKISTQNAANKKSIEINKMTIDNMDIENTPSPEWIKYQQERYQNLDKLSATYQNFIKSSQLPKNSGLPKVELSKMKTTSRQESSHQEKVQQGDFENINSKTTEESSEDKITSGIEFPSVQGFIEFIRSLKQTWMKKSLFRLDDKIKMLYQLKDTLMRTIEHQFMVLWQDDEDDENHTPATENADAGEMHENKRGSHLRSKRGILGESSINFPPDAALMSINFLTFAVFLIKLVLQVVNIVKTKHYQLSTLAMDTGAIRNG